jgi:hypothetical protein
MMMSSISPQWYGVTDEDGTWDSKELPPAFVLAQNPEHAIRLAVESWRKIDPAFRGASLKVVRMNPIGSAYVICRADGFIEDLEFCGCQK